MNLISASISINFDFENMPFLSSIKFENITFQSSIDITLAIMLVLLFLIETPGVNFGDHPLLNKSAARGHDAFTN